MKEEGNKPKFSEPKRLKTVEEMLEEAEKEQVHKRKKVKWMAVVVFFLLVAGLFYYEGMKSVKQKQGTAMNIETDNPDTSVQNEEVSSTDSPLETDQGETDGEDTVSETSTENKIDLSGITPSNLMGSNGGSGLVTKKQYLFSIKKDKDGVENDKILVTKIDGQNFETAAELQENQSIQELYLQDNTLAAIISDEESTTIHLYHVEDISNIQSATTVSVGGEWESSCIQDGILYVFTKQGLVERVPFLSDSQAGLTLQAGEKDARYFMAGSDVYTFSNQQNGKVLVQKYTLEQEQLKKEDNCELDGTAENIIAVTADSTSLKVVFSNQNVESGAITIYEISSDMKGNREIQNVRENELDVSAIFLTDGSWADQLLCFGRGADSNGNVSSGLALSLLDSADGKNYESQGDSFYLDGVVNAPVFYAGRTAFLDSEKERIGFDAYVEEGEGVLHNYYVTDYTGNNFDLLWETDLSNSKLGKVIFGQYDGTWLYLVDEYGTVEVYKGN